MGGGTPQQEALSGRERQIAQAYAEGASHRQIADRLCIAPNTVRTHLSTIYRKLGVSTKIELLRTLEGEAAARLPAWAAVASKRQVTVLHAMLDQRIDGTCEPETAAALGSAFHAAVSTAVTRHHGQLLSEATAEIGACFGIPVSDETDQERAVRCALEIADEVRCPRGAGGQIAILIGLSTGPVVATRDTANRLWGGTPVLAAALAREARGKGIVVCARTRAALGNLFAFEDLGRMAIGDGHDRVRCFSVAGTYASDTRFDALHGSRLTPIVGRDHQVGLLLGLFESASAGQGQIALICGEPGIGKSRMIRALCDQLELLPEQLLVFQCSPHEQTSPLHPVAHTVRHLAGVEQHATASARLDALLLLFGDLIADESRGRQILAELASIRYAPPAGLEPQPPERLRRATLELLERFVIKRSAGGPLLLVFEDLHWIDPSTAQWLERIVSIVETLPILVVVTFRPEYRWETGFAPNMTTLTLPRLGREQIAQIVAEQAGEAVVPPGLVERIVVRSEGVPLFVEELTRASLEFGEAGDAVPSTLQASLTGRLDRLGPAREVAQAAAVLGRDFDRDLLAEVLSCDPRALGDALDAIVDSKLMVRRAGGGPGALQFKHALVRDAAYDSLLSSRREALHAQVASALIARGDAGGDVAHELVAQHLVKGGAPERSVPFWTRAGERATRKSANHEAVSHITSGLAALGALPDDAARARCELELQLALGTPLIAVSGYTGAATVQAYARARELAERLADRDCLFQALYGVWVNHMIRGQLDKAHAIAGQLVSLAQRSESSAEEVTARRVLGFCLALQGDLEEGQRQLETALCLFRGKEHGRLFLRFGQDPRIAAISVLAWIACLRGDLKESNRLAARAISDAHELGHSYTTAYATYIAGAAPSFLMKDTPATLRYLDALTDLSTDGDFPFWKAFSLGLRASFAAREGRISEARALSSESFIILDAMSVYWFRPFIFASLAEGFLHGGDATAASHYVDVAVSTMEQTGERWIEAHLRQLTAEVARGGNPPLGVR